MRHVVEERLFGGDGLINELQSPSSKEIGSVPVFAELGIVQVDTLAVEQDAEFAALFLVGKVQLADRARRGCV